MKVNITAVISTSQYNNIQPSIEVEADTFEEAEKLVMPHIEQLSARYGEEGKQLKAKDVAVGGSVKLTPMHSAVNKIKVMFDEHSHTYYHPSGKTYLGGSTFAKKFVKQFNADYILDGDNGWCNKYGIDKQDVLDMWKLKGDVSTSIGTGIHAGLELKYKYQELSDKIENDKEHNDHGSPWIAHIIDLFHRDHKDDKVLSEVFVADDELMACGQIDDLLIVDEKSKRVRVRDYKTTVDMDKKVTVLPPFKDVIDNTVLGTYWLQLSFYAHILERAGYTVEGLDIFQLVGEVQEDDSIKFKWVTYSHDVIDITAGIEAFNKGEV